MNKLIYNYHTHTSRCGHAFGADEDYVREAIKCGIKRLGFSDHIILPQGFSQPGIRGDYDRYKDYLESIRYLKNKYKNQFDIIVGFEAEYFPELLDYYKQILNDDIDYLIMGQHCGMINGMFKWYFSKQGTIEQVKEYVDDTIAGLKTGLFKYLAHPDLFMQFFDEWSPELEKESRRLLKACEELNIPIEINICGMRRSNYDGVHRSYPNIHFFKLVRDYNLKVVLAVDAHDPSHFNLIDIERGFAFAEEVGVKIDLDYSIDV